MIEMYSFSANTKCLFTRPSHMISNAENTKTANSKQIIDIKMLEVLMMIRGYGRMIEFFIFMALQRRSHFDF